MATKSQHQDFYNPKTTVNVMCTISLYSVTNHTAKGYCSVLRCVNVVLKYVIVPLVIYFEVNDKLKVIYKL